MSTEQLTARLSISALSSVSVASRPPIDPRGIDVGIVHLGLGAFHRAHQAVYTQAAMAAGGDTSWGICGVTQRSGDVIEDLAPQDGLYSVLERGDDTRANVMAPVRELLFARDQAAALVERIASPSTRVVTLTVTEKGYRHDPSSGRLNRADPEIQADVDGRPPRTVVGQLARGLQARARGQGAPLSVVCCDNVHDNGRTLRRLVEDFCELLPAGEAAAARGWIAHNVAFPSTMVDRIVPATTAADRADAAALLGVADHGVVAAEPFMQWVIEDTFAGPRPVWEAAGAIITDDVAPYEAMKLRLLNGSHSALAYLGALAGYDYVADFVRLDDVARYVKGLMDIDVTPTLAVPAGFDVEGYKSDLLRRFGNRALAHRTTQIAMDGSQKLPQRLLGVIAERARSGTPARHATLVVAAWMRYVSAGADERLRPIAVDDPLGSLIAQCLAGTRSPAQVVDALLDLDAIFGPELRDDAETRALLVEQLTALTSKGALATLTDSAR